MSDDFLELGRGLDALALLEKNFAAYIHWVQGAVERIDAQRVHGEFITFGGSERLFGLFQMTVS